MRRCRRGQSAPSRAVGPPPPGSARPPSAELHHTARPSALRPAPAAAGHGVSGPLCGFAPAPPSAAGIGAERNKRVCRASHMVTQDEGVRVGRCMEARLVDTVSNVRCCFAARLRLGMGGTAEASPSRVPLPCLLTRPRTGPARAPAPSATENTRPDARRPSEVARLRAAPR